MPANRNRVFPLAILLLLGITSRVSVSAVSSSGGSEACEFQGGAARRRLDNLLAGFGASTDHDRDRAERENGNADGLHGFGASATAANANSSAPKQPNILFLIVDDLDKQLATLSHCPHIQRLLSAHGTTFENQFVSTALCCPMRMSIMTGMFPHNNNFTDVAAPGGGYEKMFELGLDKEALPVRMQRAGYSTYFAGKLVNGWSVANHDLVPPGWDLVDPLLMPTIYQLNNPVFSRNGAPPLKYDRYQTDIMTERAVAILEDHKKADTGKPFFMYLAPTSPHTEVWISPNPLNPSQPIVNMSICVPAPRHAHLFPDLKVPRTPNFNPETNERPSWMGKLARLSSERERVMDAWHRARVRCMQSIDEMVETLVETLEKMGELENTYLFFTSDNGFHLGQHRLGAGKMTGIEEDVRVPLIVRGPGVKKGVKNYGFNSHTDLAPTLLKIAGAPLADYFDGRPIDLHDHPEAGGGSETLAVEFWSTNFDEQANIWTPENSFKSIRLLSPTHSYYYSVWCTGEHELYDLILDPYQLHNAYHDKQYERVIGRLDALLERARVCKAETCRKPWSALHGAAVTSLSEALDPRYDGFYASRPRYVFGKCSESLYSAEEEGVPIVRLPDPKKLEEAKRRSKAWVAEKKTEGKMRVVGGQGRPFKMEPGMLLSKK